MDCLVNLYAQPLAALARRVQGLEATIRVALPPEQHLIKDWVRHHFSEYWVSEVTVAMAHQPPGCLVAVVDGKLAGFACYDATARGFFGPMGVAPEQRGRGIGLALLSATLHAMKAQGYAYAIVGSVGPLDFYRHAVGAVPIMGAGEDIYRGMLRARPAEEVPS